jgi:hypothetical protein
MALPFNNIITVRRTLDPYVDELEFVASSQVHLAPNGDLHMSELGFGNPGDQFLVRWDLLYPLLMFIRSDCR